MFQWQQKYTVRNNETKNDLRIDWAEGKVA